MLSKKVWLAAVVIAAVGLGVRLTLSPSEPRIPKKRGSTATESESGRHWPGGPDSYDLRRAPEAAQALGIAESNFLESEADFEKSSEDPLENLGRNERDLAERHARGEMRGVENAFVFTSPDASPTSSPPPEEEK